MRVQTTLRKILTKKFQNTFRRVMENWPEARDIFVFVRIAQTLENETRDYLGLLKELTAKTGFLWEREKIIEPEEPENKLLKKTLANKANGVFDTYRAELNLLLDEPLELEIPRLLIVTPNHLRKGLTIEQCTTLSILLDMSQIP